MEYTIRRLKPEEAYVLEDFLYLAIFLRPGELPPEREVIYRPELWLYVDGFGSRRGDIAVAAWADGQAVGAAWARIMDDYGHVDDETPSLAISLREGWRGKGIGRQLMSMLLEELRRVGFARASLSVQKDNYALKLYRSLGFQTVAEHDEDFIMVCRLDKSSVAPA